MMPILETGLFLNFYIIFNAFVAADAMFPYHLSRSMLVFGFTLVVHQYLDLNSMVTRLRLGAHPLIEFHGRLLQFS